MAWLVWLLVGWLVGLVGWVKLIGTQEGKKSVAVVDENVEQKKKTWTIGLYIQDP